MNKQFTYNETKDYDLFGAFVENRPYITGKSFDSLVSSIDNEGMICPIIVKEIKEDEDGIRDIEDHSLVVYGKKYGVIDGQHRLRACKSLGVPAPYVINNSTKRENIVIANNTGTSWTAKNYIRYFNIYFKEVKQDLSRLAHYENLSKSLKKYSYGGSDYDEELSVFAEGLIIRIFYNGSGKYSDDTKNGHYKFSNKYAPTTLDYCVRLKDVFGPYKDTLFVRAMHRIVKGEVDFNIDSLYNAIQSLGSSCIPITNNDADIYEKILEVHDNAENSKYVYVVSNKAWPNKYKIGVASNPESRLSNYQTGDPNRGYEMPYKKMTVKFDLVESHVIDKYGGDHEWIEEDYDSIVAELEKFM